MKVKFLLEGSIQKPEFMSWRQRWGRIDGTFKKFLDKMQEKDAQLVGENDRIERRFEGSKWKRDSWICFQAEEKELFEKNTNDMRERRKRLKYFKGGIGG